MFLYIFNKQKWQVQIPGDSWPYGQKRWIYTGYVFTNWPFWYFVSISIVQDLFFIHTPNITKQVNTDLKLVFFCPIQRQIMVFRSNPPFINIMYLQPWVMVAMDTFPLQLWLISWDCPITMASWTLLLWKFNNLFFMY